MVFKATPIQYSWKWYLIRGLKSYFKFVDIGQKMEFWSQHIFTGNHHYRGCKPVSSFILALYGRISGCSVYLCRSLTFYTVGRTGSGGQHCWAASIKIKEAAGQIKQWGLESWWRKMPHLSFLHSLIPPLHSFVSSPIYLFNCSLSNTRVHIKGQGDFNSINPSWSPFLIVD